MNSSTTVHLFNHLPKVAKVPSCRLPSAACLAPLAAANEVNYLDTIAIMEMGLFPIRAPDNFTIYLNGNSLWRERQLLNQFLKVEGRVGKFAGLAINMNLHDCFQAG